MSASRLKDKPLLEINRLPIICHVLNKAKETGLESFVATEDEEILNVVKKNGGEVQTVPLLPGHSTTNILKSR